jgi:hypothetical protein
VQTLRLLLMVSAIRSLTLQAILFGTMTMDKVGFIHLLLLVSLLIEMPQGLTFQLCMMELEA